MTIGAIAELKSIDTKGNSLFKALQDPHLHRIASLMMKERLLIEVNQNKGASI